MKVTFDEGTAFGLGVFETIAIENGRPVFLEEHTERMQKGAMRLGLLENKEQIKKFQSELSLDTVQTWIGEQGLQRGALKLVVTKENCLFLRRKNPYCEEDYSWGFTLEYSPIRRNETSPLTYLKTLNYGDNILEKRRANREGFDEPIFLNSRGEVTEGATTNLFVVKGGKILTPPVHSGLLPGILRMYVMQNFPVQEQILYPRDLEEADEMFVTNSLLGIMAVRQIGSKKFTERTLIQKIQKQYKNLLS